MFNGLKKLNPYEGVIFRPSVNLYAATIPNGQHMNVIGHYDTLRQAIDARRAALNNQGSK